MKKNRVQPEKSKNDGQSSRITTVNPKLRDSGSYNSKNSKNVNQPHGTTKKNPKTADCGPDNRQKSKNGGVRRDSRPTAWWTA
jgi:hypothetical protein